MKLGAWALAISGLLLATVVSAQEPTPPPAPAPAPRDVRLLDDVPNYAEILRHQWKDGVPADVTRAEQTSEYYGRLGRPRHDAGVEPHRLHWFGAEEQHGPADSAAQPGCRDRRRAAGVVAVRSARRRLSESQPQQHPGHHRPHRGRCSPFIGTFFTSELDANAGLRKTLLTGGALSLDFTNQRLVTNPSIASPITPRYVTTLGLSLNQPLLRNFGWRYALLVVEIAQNTEQATYQQYAAGIANTIAQVERVYWNLVLAIEAVHVQEQSLALAQELERQNEGKFNVGAMPQTSVLEAKSQVASREATLIQARNLEVRARDNLRAIINAREPDCTGTDDDLSAG